MPIQPKQQPPYYETKNQIKTYKAILTQNGVNPPIATILVNDIGNISWGRSATGSYAGTLTDSFPINKTWITLQTINGATILPISYLSTNDQIEYFTYTIGTGFTDNSIICIEINTLNQ